MVSRYPAVQVAVQFASARLCARLRSLVPLVKTRDFGMMPAECNCRNFQTGTLPAVRIRLTMPRSLLKCEKVLKP
jgi:hypothetical protein